MSAEDYDYLQEAALKGKDVPFEKLEMYFPAAFKRITDTASKRGLDPHSYEAIKTYFREDHNKVIDDGDGMYGKMPKTFCEFCKVKELSVLEKKIENEQLYLRVEKTRWVQAPFFKQEEIKIGDYVTVHHALAVELLR